MSSPFLLRQGKCGELVVTLLSLLLLKYVCGVMLCFSLRRMTIEVQRIVFYLNFIQSGPGFFIFARRYIHVILTAICYHSYLEYTFTDLRSKRKEGTWFNQYFTVSLLVHLCQKTEYLM